MARRPIAADIKALRETSGDGLETCRASLLREWRKARLQELRNDAGDGVILELIEFLQQTERDCERR